MEKSKLEHLLIELQQHYRTQHGGLGVITRVELAKRGGGLFTQKTLANWDSEGKGIGRWIRDERSGQMAYYIDDVATFMRKKFEH